MVGAGNRGQANAETRGAYESQTDALTGRALPLENTVELQKVFYDRIERDRERTRRRTHTAPQPNNHHDVLIMCVRSTVRSDLSYGVTFTLQTF